MTSSRRRALGLLLIGGVLSFGLILAQEGPPVPSRPQSIVYGYIGIIGVAFASFLAAAWMIERRFRGWGKDEAEDVVAEHNKDHKSHEAMLLSQFAKWRAETAEMILRHEETLAARIAQHEADPRAHPDAFERFEERLTRALEDDRRQRQRDGEELLTQLRSELRRSS